MENNELQNIWKNLDSRITPKSKDELKQLLSAKIKATINKFLFSFSISAVICIGLIVFLVITALNRQSDILYQLNNLTLGLITVISLLSSLVSWHKLRNNRNNQPVMYWLERRISLLSRWLTGKYSKLYLFVLPILFILTFLSIHVYYENILYIEVIKTVDSIIGLIAGTIIGLFVSYFGAIKIKKLHLKNLEYLKELHSQLCTVIKVRPIVNNQG